MTPRATPARKRATRRKTASYSVPIKVRAAYLAGEGKTARQICDELGISEPHKLRAMFRSVGIKPRATGSVVIALPRAVLDALAVLADRADMAPEEFTARVVTVMVIEEPTVLQNILEIGAPDA